MSNSDFYQNFCSILTRLNFKLSVLKFSMNFQFFRFIDFLDRLITMVKKSDSKKVIDFLREQGAEVQTWEVKLKSDEAKILGLE